MRKLLLASAWVITAVAVAGGVAAWRNHVSQPDYLLRQGETALHARDPDHAALLVDQLESAGHTDHACLLRGEIYLYRNRFAPALLEFNRIRDQGSLRRDAAAYSGQCLLQLKNPLEAMRCFEFVLSEQADQVECHRGLAVIYYDQGAMERALEHLQAVARLAPDDGRPHRLMGLIHKDMGQLALAIDSYREALKRLPPDDSLREVQDELTETLVRNGDGQQALEALDSIDPRRALEPRMVALRAECLLMLARAPEARVQLDRALSQHADSIDLLKVRAKLHLQDGEGKQAVDLLEKVLKAQRHDVACRYQVIQGYQLLGQTDRAAAHKLQLEQSQTLIHEFSELGAEAEADPWNAELMLRLASACDKLDKPDLAAMWRRAAAACPATRP
jgi:tetratricopeptide (TPR) repeat protein